LENSDGDVIATALTGTNGKYKFIDLSPGEYTVEETNPPGVIDVSPSIVDLILAPGENAVVNFVNTPVSSSPVGSAPPNLLPAPTLSPTLAPTLAPRPTFDFSQCCDPPDSGSDCDSKGSKGKGKGKGGGSKGKSKGCKSKGKGGKGKGGSGSKGKNGSSGSESKPGYCQFITEEEFFEFCGVDGDGDDDDDDGKSGKSKGKGKGN
jgi:hypothetical protein